MQLWCDFLGHMDTTHVHNDTVLPSEARPFLIHHAQCSLVNVKSYQSLAIKYNMETGTCRRQKDVLKATAVKASLFSVSDAASALRYFWESHVIWNFLKSTRLLLFVCCPVWYHTASVLNSLCSNWGHWDQDQLYTSLRLFLQRQLTMSDSFMFFDYIRYSLCHSSLHKLWR